MELKEFRFELEKGNKKYTCPECNRPKKYKRYIDNELSDYIPIEYGRCDREQKCGYYLSPYPEYARTIREKERGNEGITVSKPKKRPKPLPNKVKVHIPIEELRRIQSNYEKNGFIQNLFKPPFSLPVKELERVIAQYQLGTISEGYMNGAVAFPFIDKAGNVRAIQMKQFDKSNHTLKGRTFLMYSGQSAEKGNLINVDRKWLKAYNKQESKMDCLFGEHLLPKYPKNPVALVEAPKTAIYCTLFFGFPDSPETLLWLATGGLSFLNYERCKVLEGRRVVLFPDLSLPKPGKASTFEAWSEKAGEFNKTIPGANFIASDLLEKYASKVDRNSGNDLADYCFSV